MSGGVAQNAVALSAFTGVAVFIVAKDRIKLQS
jgi:hypothetical protein